MSDQSNHDDPAHAAFEREVEAALIVALKAGKPPEVPRAPMAEIDGEGNN
jgi:hypothetical protein